MARATCVRRVETLLQFTVGVLHGVEIEPHTQSAMVDSSSLGSIRHSSQTSQESYRKTAQTSGGVRGLDVDVIIEIGVEVRSQLAGDLEESSLVGPNRSATTGDAHNSINGNLTTNSHDAADRYTGRG